MRHLLIAGLLFLSSTSLGAYTQQLQPRSREPVTIHLVNTEFGTAIDFVSKHAGIEVQFDDMVTRERRNTKLTLTMREATLEEVLDAMTRASGLSYAVVGPQTIRIYQLP
jgi:type II secretory pathway component GspD/PulD (secretin)